MNDDGKRRWKPPGKSDAQNSGRRLGERKIIAHRAKSESSKRWIERQLSDPYVQRARAEGYRARAAYKLKELNQRARFIRAGDRIVDLGCAPGGWAQVCLEIGVKELVGIDLLPVAPLPSVHIVEGDIENSVDVDAMLRGLGGPIDVVLSDMAANTTGHRQTDHLRTSALADLALDFAESNLKQSGHFCCKVFQGGATPDMLARLKDLFVEVRHIKPPASRTGSPEIYVVAKGFRKSVSEGA